jgi:hypothetical protein
MSAAAILSMAIVGGSQVTFCIRNAMYGLPGRGISPWPEWVPSNGVVVGISAVGSEVTGATHTVVVDGSLFDFS